MKASGFFQKIRSCFFKRRLAQPFAPYTSLFPPYSNFSGHFDDEDIASVTFGNAIRKYTACKKSYLRALVSNFKWLGEAITQSFVWMPPCFTAHSWQGANKVKLTNLATCEAEGLFEYSVVSIKTHEAYGKHIISTEHVITRVRYSKFGFTTHIPVPQKRWVGISTAAMNPIGSTRYLEKSGVESHECRLPRNCRGRI